MAFDDWIADISTALPVGDLVREQVGIKFWVVYNTYALVYRLGTAKCIDE